MVILCSKIENEQWKGKTLLPVCGMDRFIGERKMWHSDTILEFFRETGDYMGLHFYRNIRHCYDHNAFSEMGSSYNSQM